MTLALALLVIGAWGVWLMPVERARERSQFTIVLYATAANLALAAAVAAGTARGAPALPPAGAGAIALGGGLWTLGGACAFAAVRALGPARAMSLWAPLNILVSLGWGGALFGEFRAFDRTQAFAAAAGVAMLIAGLLAIIRVREAPGARQAPARGVLAAVGAGLLWGSYFLPIRMTGASPWTASLPMAAGMAAGAVALVALRRAPWRLQSGGDAWRLPAAGLLWGAGNYASLLLMERIGTGRGFAVAQLCLVVNALVGILLLRRPAPGSRAARRIALGCVLATAGGVVLGLSR